MKFPSRFFVSSLAGHALGFFASLLLVGLLFRPQDFLSVFASDSLVFFGSFSFAGWLIIGLPWTAIGVREGWHVKRTQMICSGLGGSLLAMIIISFLLGGLVHPAYFVLALCNGALSGLAYREIAVRWQPTSISEK